MVAFLKGFLWAARGIGRAVYEERNLRFDLCVAFFVITFSFFYKLEPGQYALLAVVIGGVLALELFNSALERIVDQLSPRYSAQAGTIKNIAAGAVLVFCIGAAICGVLMFWDTAVFADIFRHFYSAPWLVAALLVTLVAAVWFTFFFGAGKKREPRDTADAETKAPPKGRQ